MKILLLLIVVVCSYYMPLSNADEEGRYIQIKYVGDVYQRLIVLDAKRKPLFNRKLVPGQSFSVPELIDNKQVKKLYAQFYQQELELKVGCSSKLVNKSIAADLLMVSSTLAKPVCVKKSRVVDTLVTTAPSAVNSNIGPSSVSK